MNLITRKAILLIELASQLVLQELRNRYRGTFLGIAWAFISAGGLLAIYTLVFVEIFPTQEFGPVDANLGVTGYALILFAGLIPYWAFNEILTRSGTLVTSYPQYVKSVSFPTEMLPVAASGMAMFTAMINLTALVIAKFFITKSGPANLSVIIYLLPLLMLACLATSWFLAALGVFFKDMPQIITVAGQFLFFASPILYPLSAAPEWLQKILIYNPLTYLIEGFRYAVLGTQAPSVGNLLALGAYMSLLCLLGYSFFRKMKPHFASAL